MIRVYRFSIGSEDFGLGAFDQRDRRTPEMIEKRIKKIATDKNVSIVLPVGVMRFVAFAPYIAESLLCRVL